MQLSNEDLLNLQIAYYFQTSITHVQVQDILVYIDSPVFLQEVKNARKVLKIKEAPFDNYTNLYATYIENSPFSGFGMTPKQFSKLEDRRSHICRLLTNENAWQTIFSRWKKRNSKKINALGSLVNKILIRFEQPYTKKAITQQAILLGFIGYSNDIRFRLHGKITFSQPTNVLVVDHRTTYKQVKEALKLIKSLYNQPKKDSQGKIHKSNKTSYYPKIMDYHQWYWKRLEGLTYAEIADWWYDKLNPEVDYDDKYKTYVNEFSNTNLLTRQQFEDQLEREFEKVKIVDETEIIKGVKKYQKILLK